MKPNYNPMAFDNEKSPHDKAIEWLIDRINTGDLTEIEYDCRCCLATRYFSLKSGIASKEVTIRSKDGYRRADIGIELPDGNTCALEVRNTHEKDRDDQLFYWRVGVPMFEINILDGLGELTEGWKTRLIYGKMPAKVGVLPEQYCHPRA